MFRRIFEPESMVPYDATEIVFMNGVNIVDEVFFLFDDMVVSMNFDLEIEFHGCSK